MASIMYNGCKEGKLNLRNACEAAMLSILGLVITALTAGMIEVAMNLIIFFIILGVYDSIIRVGEYVARVVRPGTTQVTSDALGKGQS